MTNAPTAERQHVRVLYDVLTGLVDELDQTADEADLRAHLIQRQRRARAQLSRSNRADLRPVVLDPTQLTDHMSRQGQPLTPVLTTDTAPTGDLSSAVVRMPPHHAALAHVHHHTGVTLVLLEGQAITLWWDDDGQMHALPQQAGQHLYMPPGLAHAAINPYGAPAVGAEIRNNPVFDADNHLLPALQADVIATLTTTATKNDDTTAATAT